MKRRDFFTHAVIGGSVLFTAPTVLISCAKNEVTNPSGSTIDLNSSAFSGLQSVGGYAYSGNIIIIRTGESSYVALSKVCTHQGCTVDYSKSGNRIVCPCHLSTFDINGNVLGGPAPRSLKKYTVTVNGSTLVIG